MQVLAAGALRPKEAIELMSQCANVPMRQCANEGMCQ